MVQKINSLLILAFIGVTFGFSQLQIDPLNYSNRMNNEIYGEYKTTNHSSILPIITTAPSFEKGKGYLIASNKSKNTHFIFYPLADLSLGIQNEQNPYGIPFDAGLGLGMDISANKLFFTAKILPYFTNSGFVRDSIQTTAGFDPGGSRSIDKNLFLQNEVTLAYRPNKFFTFIGGNGRNFFGEGYRSLILSDNAVPNPFFKIETSFAKVKYVNLYQMWKDNTVDPSNHSLDQNKFAAMHYISWNITREFNVSIFETVVWQANDTLINRGFDPNYLNPIVFYRPVEYGNGSADNVLLGANMSFKFDNYNSIYTQLILDDFLLSEIRARSRWWANKYGFQFGFKSYQFLNKKDLFFQTEFNLVRPFTYSHKHSSQSYGHLNASVAHPIGANFIEILNIVSYKKNNFRITNKIVYSGYGVDSSATSYGQNVFASYSNRDGDYDHYIMQGDKKNVINETVMIEYPIMERINLYLNLTYNLRAEFTPRHTQHIHTLSVGLRSRIWNRYTDF